MFLARWFCLLMAAFWAGEARALVGWSIDRATNLVDAKDAVARSRVYAARSATWRKRARRYE